MLIARRHNKYNFSPKLRGLLLWGLFAVASTNVQANTLEDVTFSSLPGDRFEARVQFSETPPAPESYSIEQPARIVVDFPNVDNGTTERRIPLSVGAAKSAMVISGDNRTRLILNLSEPRGFSGRVEGNVYIIEVGEGTPANTTAQATSAQAPSTSTNQRSSRPSAASGQPAITNIDFRRGESGEGRVVISLSGANINVDLQESSGAIELRFDGASIPSSLANRYDVRDFATPVHFVDADNERAGGIIRVDADGQYDYLAYQADNEYVLSVKPLTAREMEERQERFTYVGDKITLNFQDIAVRSVLQILADFTGLNLVASDSIGGSITLRLDNVPWDQALELVLKTKGLDKRQIGNVLMVAPAAEIAEQERLEIETKRQLEELAPLRTEYIRVRYANAAKLYQLFLGNSGGQGGGGQGMIARGQSRDGGSNNQNAGGILSERGQAIVDDRTNSIILTDTEEKIAQFRALIEQIDVPIRQVQIEARLVVANTNIREELGIEWGASGDDTPNTAVVQSEAIVDLGVTGPTGQIAVDIITDNVLLDLELSALASNGQAEIVSQPKIITGDKQQATIESGSEVPYLEASASGAATISFKEAVLKMDVTPQITPDNNIIMDLVINQDAIGEIIQLPGGLGSIPTIDVTQITTQVLVADGQTVVLGGIFTTERTQGISKVPFFGDIPYVGRMFRREVNSDSKAELLIFITPKILAETLVQ